GWEVGGGGGGYVAAGSATEAALVGIWEEVLGRRGIGVEDNFFDLGGHSLLLTQAASRMRQALGVEVGVRTLFEHPTIRGLGQQVEAARRRRAGADPGPVRRADRGQSLPLSFSQQRLWFIDQLAPGRAFYNIPAAVWLRGVERGAWDGWGGEGRVKGGGEGWGG